MDGVSGVGISFGADRIYDVLNGLNLYPEATTRKTQVIFLNMGDAETAFVLPVLKRLREAGVPAEIYADAAKFKKQMSYANDRAIPYVAIVGESELQNGVIALKDMTSGEQQNLTPDELISKFVK